MLNKNQIRILKGAYNDSLSPKKLSQALNLSYITIIRNLECLRNAALITQETVKPLHILKLEELINNNTNLDFLRKPHFTILLSLLNRNLSVEEIKDKNDLKKTQVYKGLKELTEQAFIFKKGDTYGINDTLRPDLIEFLRLYQATKTYHNPHLPKGSKVLLENNREIIFENEEKNLEYHTTAFSAFDFTFNYKSCIYTTQRKRPTRQQVYLDALSIAKTSREYLLCALYFLYHKNDLNDTNHPTHRKLYNIIYEKREYRGFPKKKEIEEKLYDNRR